MSQEPKDEIPGLMARSGCFLIGCGCAIPILFVLWLLFMGAVTGGK